MHVMKAVQKYGGVAHGHSFGYVEAMTFRVFYSLAGAENSGRISGIDNVKWIQQYGKACIHIHIIPDICFVNCKKNHAESNNIHITLERLKSTPR